MPVKNKRSFNHPALSSLLALSLIIGCQPSPESNLASSATSLQQASQEFNSQLLARLQSAPRFSLQGQLKMPQTSATPTALAMHKITVYGPDGLALGKAITDAEGRYTIKDLPSGLRYEVLATDAQSMGIARALFDSPLNQTAPRQVDITPRSTALAEIIRGALQDGRSGLNRVSLDKIEAELLRQAPNLMGRLTGLWSMQYLSARLAKQTEQLQRKQAIDSLFSIAQVTSEGTATIQDLVKTASAINTVGNNLPTCTEQQDPGVTTPLSNPQTTSLGAAAVDLASGKAGALDNLSQTNTSLNQQVTQASSSETKLAGDLAKTTSQDSSSTSQIVANSTNPPGDCNATLLTPTNPSPVPTPSVTSSPTPTQSVSPTPLATPTPSPTPSASPTQSATPSPTPTPTPSPSTSASPAASLFTLTATPVTGQEYTQIKLEFKPLVGIAYYKVYNGTQLLGAVTTKPEDKLATFKAESLQAGTAYNFKVEVAEGAESGKISATAKASTWASTASSSSGGGGSATPAPPDTTLRITSITPASAPIGGTITIEGANFSTTPASNLVSIGGTAATVLTANSTTLTVTMPTKVADTYAANVVVGANTSNSINVTTLSTMTSYAGTGTPGFSGENTAATSAQLNQPWGLEMNAAGHLAIADSANHRVRFIPGTTATIFGSSRTAGNIYTVAGDGTASFGGVDVVGTAAQLNTPKGVTLSGANNIQIVDSGNARIRLLAGTTGSSFNLTVTSGRIYTLAGTGTGGAATNGVTRMTVGDNQNSVEAVARHLNGTIYADMGNQFIRLASLLVTTNFGIAVGNNQIHNVVGNGTGGTGGDGGTAITANINSPGGLFNLQAPTTTDDNLYIADTANHRIRLVPELTGTYFGQAITGNNIGTVAGNGTVGFSGDGAAATGAQLSSPRGIFVNSTGMWIADTGNNRIRFVPSSSGFFYGQNMTANFIYTIGGTGTAGYNSDGIQATTAHLNAPYGVTVDSNRNVYVSDRDNHRIRRISP